MKIVVVSDIDVLLFTYLRQVVVCVGCEPNTSIALTSGLEVDRSLGGFVVNAELEARRNLFVVNFLHNKFCELFFNNLIAIYIIFTAVHRREMHPVSTIRCLAGDVWSTMIIRWCRVD